ncbi:MAG: 16S rRNA (guanine(966)-N(2))-methyltransferase RsmD [Butyricicoccaceae bacterium]
MRVISGSARGKKLETVEGMDTRPTTDRVKESVFNIIQTRVRGARVLDLFAGSGQMGIEALSRGAESAVFADKAPKAQAVIRKNLAAARVGDRAQLLCCDFQNAVKRVQGEKFDLIYLDPPYGGILLNQALKEIESFDILQSDGIIICESYCDDRIECPERFEVLRQYKYGTIRLTTMALRPEE